MEATASIIPAAFAAHPTNPFVQKHKVTFPRHPIHIGSLRASASDSGTTKSVRLTIQAEDPSSKSDPAKLVIEVPQQEEAPHKAVTDIASESAVESPDKVHEQAKQEAKSFLNSDRDLEEVSRNLEQEAEKVSEKEAEHLTNGRLDGQINKMATEPLVMAGDQVGKEDREMGTKARDVVPQSGKGVQVPEEVRELDKEGLIELRKAVQEVLKESKTGVQKRAQVFAEAAEDASQKGNRVMEVAKKGFEEIKTRLTGVQEGVTKVAGDVQKNVGELQKKVEEQVKGSGVQEGVTKVAGDVQKNVGELQKKVEEQLKKGQKTDVNKGDFYEKHRAVDVEDVNKDGEQTLAKQREMEGDDVEEFTSELKKGHPEVESNVNKRQAELQSEIDKKREGSSSDKHRAVDTEDVNKDGEQTLAKQREMEGDDVEKVTSELRKGHPEVESNVNKRQAELQSEMDKKREESSYDKHRAVDSEDVNKDGEKKLAEQRAKGQYGMGESEVEHGEGEESAVKEAIHEHVDPVMGKVREELDSEVTVGDGTEHLKNMNDLVLHDAYAPVDEE